MKSFFQRALAVCVLTTMLLCMAACSVNDTPASTKAPDTVDTTPQDSADTPSTDVKASDPTVSYPIQTEDNKLTFWLPIQPIASKYISSYNDHLIYNIISENTGMDIEFINCAPADGATQLSLLIASNDIPDIMQIRGMYPGGAAAGVNEGVFVDLTPYLEQHAPDYYKAIRTSDLCYAWSPIKKGMCFPLKSSGRLLLLLIA